MLIIYAILGLNFLTILILAFAWIQIYFMQKLITHLSCQKAMTPTHEFLSNFVPPENNHGGSFTQPSVPKKNKPKVVDEFRAYQIEQEHIASRKPTQEFSPEKQYWG